MNVEGHVLTSRQHYRVGAIEPTIAKYHGARGAAQDGDQWSNPKRECQRECGSGMRVKPADRRSRIVTREQLKQSIRVCGPLLLYLFINRHSQLALPNILPNFLSISGNCAL
jgi:hypothetical protein